MRIQSIMLISVCWLGGLLLPAAWALDPALFDGSEEEVSQTTNAPPTNPDAPLPENVKSGSTEEENEEGQGTVTNKMEQAQPAPDFSQVEREAPVLEPLQRRTDLPPEEKEPSEAEEDSSPPAVDVDLEKFIPSDDDAGLPHQHQR